MMATITCQSGSSPTEPQCAFAIAHTSDIATVRRRAVQLAQKLGFDETAAGRVAIVATEAATNILKHAGEGQILLRPLVCRNSYGVELLALDKGPGIANIARSLRDGVSTTGTAGTGLGAMHRLADTFDVYTAPGQGSAFHLCLWAGAMPPEEALICGAVCVPLAGEQMCGDDWSVQPGDGSATLMVVDGLGHGPMAAAAAQAAVQAAHANPRLSPLPLLDAVHQALRPTRGAAIAVLQLDLEAGTLRFAGVGNISASMLDDGPRKSLTSQNGIVGHNMRKTQELQLAWPKTALVIAHSDGLSTQWNLEAYPGLSMRHPALIAGVLFRDFARPRDDATVVVLRRRQE